MLHLQKTMEDTALPQGVYNPKASGKMSSHFKTSRIRPKIRQTDLNSNASQHISNSAAKDNSQPNHSKTRCFDDRLKINRHGNEYKENKLKLQGNVLIKKLMFSGQLCCQQGMTLTVSKSIQD